MSEKTTTERSIVVNGALLPDGLDERMIRDVVHGFYGAIGSDELLGPIFNGAIAPDAWPAHLAKMCDFWSSILLKSSRYEGRPLPPHLRIAGLGEEHFRRWLTLFRATAQRVCPPDVAALFMERALRIAHSFRLAVAFNSGENTLAIVPISEPGLHGG